MAALEYSLSSSRQPQEQGLLLQQIFWQEFVKRAFVED